MVIISGDLWTDEDEGGLMIGSEKWLAKVVASLASDQWSASLQRLVTDEGQQLVTDEGQLLVTDEGWWLVIVDIGGKWSDWSNEYWSGYHWSAKGGSWWPRKGGG